MSAIRAWVLIDRDGEYVDVELAGEKDMHDNERVLALEAAPTLDLLERAYPLLMTLSSPVPDEVKALLRAHGRLGGET
jgi:hypothetical protein